MVIIVSTIAFLPWRSNLNLKTKFMRSPKSCSMKQATLFFCEITDVDSWDKVQEALIKMQDIGSSTTLTHNNDWPRSDKVTYIFNWWILQHRPWYGIFPLENENKWCPLKICPQLKQWPLVGYWLSRISLQSPCWEIAPCTNGSKGISKFEACCPQKDSAHRWGSKLHIYQNSISGQNDQLQVGP